jgi:hypothetical protein
LNATFDFMTKRALADGDDFNPTQVFRMLQSWFDPARLGPDAEPEDSAWNVVFSKEVNMLTTIYENGGMQFENDQGGLVITMAAVPDIHPV